MPIKSLKLSNVGPFRPRPDGSGSDGIELEFDANVNLFIGPNNVGKSTILQALAAVTARNVGFASQLPSAFRNAIEDFRGDYNRPGADVSLTWANSIGDYRRLWNVLAYLKEGDYDAAVLEIGGPDGSVEVDTFEPLVLLREFGYVGYYNPASPRTAPSYVTNPFWGVRRNQPVWDEDDDPDVYRAVDMKLRGDSSERDVSAEIDQMILEITDTKEFRVKMGVDIFADDPGSGHEEWRKGQGKFETTDGELTYPELSHGTRSVFAWVSQFVLGMAGYYEAHEYYGWQQQPGIFIIDEIDAHLHPSWQRRIIPTLQLHFPNVQIFASTHSPMMVAGLKAGQVHLLKRDDSKQVVWSRNEQDIIGWTADEIYRTFMWIEDPTDELTVQRANRLRELRRKESLAPEEEREMDELRRLVNQDLLSKGPVGPQNERYSELMHRFLRSLETELSQDGA